MLSGFTSRRIAAGAIDIHLRDRRSRAAAAAAARLSRDPRDVAQDRAAPGAALHRGVSRPARLRRQFQAGRRRRPLQLFQARDGRRHDRGDGGARPRQLFARRPRSRGARRLPPGAGPPAGGAQACPARHRVHQGGVRNAQHGPGGGVFSLAFPDPAGAVSGNPERRRTQVLPGNDIRKWSRNPQAFGDALVAEYLRAFSDPACIHATCECYRAGATVDLENDRQDVAAGRKIACPSLVLWGEEGVVGKLCKPLETWRDLIAAPAGKALPCGHFLPEEAPEQTLAALLEFL